MIKKKKNLLSYYQVDVDVSSGAASITSSGLPRELIRFDSEASRSYVMCSLQRVIILVRALHRRAHEIHDLRSTNRLNAGLGPSRIIL
jgi:hypothetical protein